MFKNTSVLLLLVVTVISVNHITEVAACKCPENEFFTECGADCQTTCATLNQPCGIVHITCPTGCYCKKGYARDDSGKCIPVGRCPK
ncbi:venom serine protease inhibitor-like [Lucilia sericata]|uniref:venom serine protease inhibitor-like n=1 Tax=Lucilia sericata TaxID=13632 RepID=UPI0018A7EB1E|nr:venom serine protease inhibitor-like [Lucilia sericata]